MVASRENIEFHKRIYSIARNPEAEFLLEGRTRVVRTVADSLGGYARLGSGAKRQKCKRWSRG